jgi:hypothetical protein
MENPLSARQQSNSSVGSAVEVGGGNTSFDGRLGKFLKSKVKLKQSNTIPLSIFLIAARGNLTAPR